MNLPLPPYTPVDALPEDGRRNNGKESPQFAWTPLPDHLRETLPGVWVRIDAPTVPRSGWSKLADAERVELAIRQGRLYVKANP
jgi:hypothetical protein